jgi:uncharacterized SAM-binding protein YcdF (DUF218 family)
MLSLSTLWLIPDNVQKADVIVAVGIGLRMDGSLSNLSQAVAQKAVDLYKDKFSPTIIFTGGFVQNSTTEAEAMRDYAIERGVPRKDTIIETNSVSTPANADETLKIIKKENFKSVLVVAQHIHARRVTFLFRKKLGDNHSLYWSSAFSKYDDVPGQKRLLSESRFLLWEIFWIITYRLVGYRRF